ncbi:MAG TPA: cytochrome c [Rhizomicrobium sp.]|jgi:mono/diheme cytochrome c family protein
MFGASLVLLLLALCAPAQAADPGTVARGHYLFVLGDCEGCHAGANGPLGGGQSFTAPFGTVYSSNISPDRNTGIGLWSADDFYKALHRGVSRDGSHLYPAFPYPYFAHLSRSDSDALLAYLKSQPPVHAVPPHAQLYFPFNIRANMIYWNALYLNDKPLPYDAKHTPQWNRGAFLIKGPGHCAECHTPKNFMFADKNSDALGGAIVEGWFAADLTATKRSGLGDWSAEEIAQYLKTGVTGKATAVGPMQEVVAKSTSRMTDADRAAIAAYLKSLPPRAAPAHENVQVPRDAMAEGQAVFVAHCSICHKPTARESTGGFPLLPHNTLVQNRDPSTVLRVILGGSQSIALADKTTSSYSMPSFATLNDEEIASVATFIRNAWGNRGSAVKPSGVKALRQ